MKITSWKKIAEHYSRDIKTVRAWKDKGAPIVELGGKNETETDELDRWLALRSDRITDDALLNEATGDDREELLKARIEKLRLENAALKRTKDREEGLVAPVEEMEASVTKLLFKLKQHMSELFNQLLESSDISAGEKEKLNADFINGLNEIAGIKPQL